MSYLQDKKNKRKKVQLAIFGVVVLFVVIYFNKPIFTSLSFVANKAFKPILVVSHNIGSNVSQIHIYFKSKIALERENEQLKNERTSAELELINHRILVEENEDLKEALGRKGEDTNQVMAAILVKPGRSMYDTLVVDAGGRQGLSVGDLVFAFGNIPVGKVAEVFDDSAKVVLFSTSLEKTDVVVAGKNAIMQIVGRGGGNFEMILPRDFELAEGTEVALPGIHSYVLAKVVTVISDPRDSYKKALLISPVNIQELKFVEIEI